MHALKTALRIALLAVLLIAPRCGDSDEAGDVAQKSRPGIASIDFGDSPETVYREVRQSKAIDLYTEPPDGPAEWDRNALVRLFGHEFVIAFSFNSQERLYRIRLSTRLGETKQDVDRETLKEMVDWFIESYSRKYGEPYQVYSVLTLPEYEGGTNFTAKWRLFNNRYSIEHMIQNRGYYEFVVSLIDDVEYFGTILREPSKRGPKDGKSKKNRQDMNGSRDIL